MTITGWSIGAKMNVVWGIGGLIVGGCIIHFWSFGSMIFEAGRLTQQVQHLQTDLAEFKKSSQSEMQRLADRVDRLYDRSRPPVNELPSVRGRVISVGDAFFTIEDRDHKQRIFHFKKGSVPPTVGSSVTVYFAGDTAEKITAESPDPARTLEFPPKQP